jgi:hypothetical protein
VSPERYEVRALVAVRARTEPVACCVACSCSRTTPLADCDIYSVTSAASKGFHMNFTAVSP